MKNLHAVQIFVLFMLLIGVPTSINENGKEIIDSPYQFLLDRYNEIKKAEDSELKDLWLKIIEHRISCYSRTSDYTTRLQICRKEYIYEILRTAREQTKSTPSLGEFIRCIRDCPLAFSFCKGEEYIEESGMSCMEIETLCIEKCLDRYWRGRRLED